MCTANGPCFLLLPFFFLQFCWAWNYWKLYGWISIRKLYENLYNLCIIFRSNPANRPPRPIECNGKSSDRLSRRIKAMDNQQIKSLKRDGITNVIFMYLWFVLRNICCWMISFLAFNFWLNRPADSTWIFPIPGRIKNVRRFDQHISNFNISHEFVCPLNLAVRNEYRELML